MLKVTTRFINKDPIIQVIDVSLGEPNEQRISEDTVHDNDLFDLDQYCEATNSLFVAFTPTPVTNPAESSFIAVGVFKEIRL